MDHVALVGALAVGVLCAAIGFWGAWLWYRVIAETSAFNVGVRVAQAACGLQALLAAAVYAAGDHVDSQLYYLYALLPLFVGFATEQLRILSAQTVLDARGLENAQAVGELPAAQQRSVVVAIVRRETGIMALGLLVIAFLCWRAAITI